MADTTTTIGARATVRYLRVSPFKVRPVLDLIRGLAVEDAERTLQLCQRSAADDVFKLLESAIANADDVHDLEPEELYVARCWADEGPTRKTGRPRARGRFSRINKRTAHVTIELERFEQEELEHRRERDEARGGASAEARRRRAERVAKSKADDEHDHDEHDHDEHDHDEHDHDEHDHDHELDGADTSPDGPEASVDSPDSPESSDDSPEDSVDDSPDDSPEDSPDDRDEDDR